MAYPKQFFRLGFHAFGRVDKHDGAVRRHEGPVGVFGEVLMARGVQNIDAVALVIKLQYR